MADPVPDLEPVITGLSALSACGRGAEVLYERAAAGEPAFGPVTRFDVSRFRAGAAAQLPGNPVLADELAAVTEEACTAARLSAGQRAGSRLLLAGHTDPAAARLPAADRARRTPAADARTLADRCGLRAGHRAYTTACVAGSTAVADAAAAIRTGSAERVVVAAGYLVDEEHFALFDAGRALAPDGRVRPFSAGRQGMVLGDGVAAVVLESAAAARRRGAPVLARLAGWGRAGDAHHVSQPHPQGTGLARAVRNALHRAGRRPEDIGYVNAHGTGTAASDAAETVGLRAALGDRAALVPVSSSKSVHGHTLESSGLLELVVTVGTLRAGRLPVNAGYLGADERCGLNLVTEGPHRAAPRYALSLNAAFGGANTALLVGAA
ncbi:beta-ketoacyl-[acyl-carrier-protein] synthase family protein [Kitasatospora cineracea]|uniref:3-oxoacyl-(Acyl-carrier-protein) synthase n=1 Tax=Kitasatospora cineracea TaxID=88074 RepID=A0A3N4RNG6_9ACTN|nr:beta-ketoacyl synthase N-terminal-like domain-containing protein [Kitasatospora cineracea]ROR38089.1 3-oxoacyl-(acyl-carrier-protein) synthase [Kitasatospora cineracea]RPE28510.1 3-oxoacyl-(acyl-carrier-protein) synthase [Kitasatospora cineracea]